MFQKLKDLFEGSTDVRSAAIASIGAGVAYLGTALMSGGVSGGAGMLLAAAGSVAVNAFWKRLKVKPDSNTPAPKAA